MHEEYERVVTGRTPRKGLTPLGWIVATFAFFVAAGTLGAGFVAYKVAKEVRGGFPNVTREISETVTRELGMAPDIAAVRMAARLASADELVSMDPERGLALLSDVQDVERPGELLKALSGSLRMPDGSAHPDAPDAPAAPDAPVTASADGASMRIHSDDGDVSFQFQKSRDGGFLTIDSDEGRVRLEFLGGDEGARIRIRTDESRMEAAFGDDAESAPAWMDDLGQVPGRAEPVISLTSERGSLGAVAWEADGDAAELLAAYQEQLESAGYEVKAEHRVRDGYEEHGSLWARNEADGRMVFVVAHQDHRGGTGVLMGYGEKR